tara:strand:- start:1465 stop:1785 length:321 start_codon:yes stop_codon:yes gene_type:complete
MTWGALQRRENKLIRLRKTVDGNPKVVFDHHHNENQERVISLTTRPIPASSFNVQMISSAAKLSRPDVGSSRNMIFGSRTNCNRTLEEVEHEKKVSVERGKREKKF